MPLAEAVVRTAASIPYDPSGSGLSSTDVQAALDELDAATAGAAPDDASYVVLGTDPTLTDERVLTGTANQVNIADGGAGGAVTLSTPQDIHSGASPTFARVIAPRFGTSGAVDATFERGGTAHITLQGTGTARVDTGWSPGITNLRDMGTTALAWRVGYFRSLQAQTSQEMVVRASGGTAALTIATNGVLDANVGLEVSDLTSGRVPFASTNGRLVDSVNLLFSGTVLTTHTLRGVTGQDFTIDAGDLSGLGDGHDLRLTAPDGASVGPPADGGDIRVSPGAGVNGGSNGALRMAGDIVPIGTTFSVGDTANSFGVGFFNTVIGGDDLDLNLEAGPLTGAGIGRAINIDASDGNAGAGGVINVRAGDGVGTNQDGGLVVLAGGAATGSGTAGFVRVTGDLDVTGKLTVAGLIDPTGLVVTQQTTVPGGAPAAGFGTYWVRDDGPPNVPIFTDNDGVDHVLNAAGLAGTGGATTRIATFDSAAGVTGDANFVYVAGGSATFRMSSTTATGMFEVFSSGGGAGTNQMTLQRNATQRFQVSLTPSVANSSLQILSHSTGWRITTSGTAGLPIVMQSQGGIFLETGVGSLEGTVAVRPGSNVNSAFTHFQVTNTGGTARIVDSLVAGQHTALSVNGNIRLGHASGIFSTFHTDLIEVIGSPTGTVYLMDFNYLPFGGSSSQVFAMTADGSIITEGAITLDGVLTSTVTTGTAPLVVASTTVVANLNVSQLEGNAASAFAPVSHTHLEADITDLQTYVTATTGANNRIATFTGANVIEGDTGLLYDSAADELAIVGGSNPSIRFDSSGSARDAEITQNGDNFQFNENGVKVIMTLNLSSSLATFAGQIRAQNGTAALPAIHGVGDTDTGIYFESNRTSFAASGAKIAEFNKSAAPATVFFAVFSSDDVGTAHRWDVNHSPGSGNQGNGDLILQINGFGQDSGGSTQVYARIEFEATVTTAGSEEGTVVISAGTPGADVEVARFGGTAISLGNATTDTLGFYGTTGVDQGAAVGSPANTAGGPIPPGGDLVSAIDLDAAIARIDASTAANKVAIDALRTRNSDVGLIAV